MPQPTLPLPPLRVPPLSAAPTDARPARCRAPCVQIERRQRTGMVGARHALHFQDDSIWKGRWRANLWVVTHILLIACVEALGNSLTTLLLPWMGYPDGSRENLGEARALVAVPIALILIVLPPTRP